MDRQFESTMKKFLEDFESGTEEEYAKQFMVSNASEVVYLLTCEVHVLACA